MPTATRSARTAALVLLLAGAAVQATAAPAGDVGPNSSALYVKECGACHFPYQPGLLPERSWRAVLASLNRHFGETADLKPGDLQAVTDYLLAGAADHADNQRSREVMSSLKPADTPTRVTSVLYTGGIHGGFLDPKFLGKPAVKTLADCAACHPRAADGRFVHRNYVISDELFRVLKGD